MAYERTGDIDPRMTAQGLEPFVAHTLDGRVVFANEAFCDQHGVSPDEVTQVAPWSWSSVQSAERRDEIIRAIIDTGHYSFDVGSVVEGDEVEGARHWRIESWLVRMGDEPVVASVQRDVSQQYRTTQALGFRSMLLDEVSDAVICHTLDGRMVYVNNTACVERGYTRDEFMRLRLEDLVTEAAAQRSSNVMQQLIEDGVAAFESEDVTADGKRLTVEVHARLVELEGAPIIVSVVRDISERKRAEQAVARLAFSDSLTGLPNRRVLMDRLESALAEAASAGERVALAFIDLDYLKGINDRHGHAAGDRAIELIGMRLSACVRRGDTVARFGGDEFVVLCTGLDSASAAERVAEKLVTILREPLDLDGVSATVTASVGVAVSDAATIEAAELLANADVAMYAVKDESRNAYAMYTPAMRLAHDSAAARRQVER